MGNTGNNVEEQDVQTRIIEEKDLELMRKNYEREVERFKPFGAAPEEQERFRHLVKVTGFITFHLDPKYWNAWTQDCIEDKDWAALCRITNQRFKSAALPNIYGGYHHEHSSWLVLEGAACGNVAHIPRILPPELAKVKNYLNPFAPVASHLMIGLWYQDKATLAEGVSMGEHFLMQKKPALLEKTIVAFLMDLQTQDMEKASQDLLEVCKNYRKFHRFPFGIRPFGVYAHGLYAFARLVLPEEKFAQLQMPEHDIFLPDYAKWLIENPEPDLSLYYRYPDDMKWVNEIMEAPCAKLVIHQFNLNNPNIKPRERADWSADGVNWVNNFADTLWNAGVGH